MAQSTEDKKKPASFQLKTAQNVRTTLARLFRLRYNEVIDSAKCRDLVYIARGMLEHDRYLLEAETNKRLDALEQLVKGEGNTNVLPADVDNEYSVSLRRQLAAAEGKISDLTNKLLELKRGATDA
jgi:hypothetical protein